jgi:hypothetical protein
LRWLYRTAAPKPGTQYGDVLPVAKDADGSIRPAMPNMVREGVLGILDLLAGTKTGELTARGANALTMGGLGAGASMAPRGAVAAGGARAARSAPKPLPMDEASRFARAREMEMNPNHRLYHTTRGPDFEEFGFGPGTAQSGGVPSPGIWAAENPQYTNALAHAFDTEGSSGVRTIPLMARKGKVAQYVADGTETPFDIYTIANEAWARGYDSIRFANYNTLGDGTPAVSWLFREPNQLRSRFAKFDPANRDSADLLAGIAAPAPVAPP